MNATATVEAPRERIAGVPAWDYDRTNWQGVGTTIPDGVYTAEEAIQKAKLDWDVELEPLFQRVEPNGGKTVPFHPLTNHRAVVRHDTGDVLGVVGNRFTPLQNVDAFRMFDEVVGHGDAKYVSGTAINGGRRVALIAQLGDDMLIGNDQDEAVRKFLLLAHGHDGSLALTLKHLPTRLACWNALAQALRGEALTWKVKHTAALTGKVDDARRVLQLSESYFRQFEAEANGLLRKHMRNREMKRFIRNLVPMPHKAVADISAGGDGGRAAANCEERRAAIQLIHDTSDNLGNIRGTKWGMYQAVAEYSDWHRPVRASAKHTAEERRFVRATEPDRLKSKAYKLLTA